MKKILWILAVAVFAVGSVVSQASAFSLGSGSYKGDVQFKFFDWTVGRAYTATFDANGQPTSDWTPSPATARNGLSASSTPLTNGAYKTNPDAIADSWSLITVMAITNGAGTQNLWTNGKDNEQLTGVIWGYNDTYISGTQTSQTLLQEGGWIKLWLSTQTAAFDPTVNFPSGLTVANGYTAGNPLSNDVWNATNGTPFLVLEAQPGIDAFYTSATRSESVNGLTVPFSGSGSGYFDVIGGNYASLFDSNSQTGGTDAYAIFNFDGTAPRAYFDSYSSDPARLKVVPEPATILLLGLGLLGLAGLRRKRTQR